MIKKIIFLLKSLLLTASFMIISCSKNLDNMSVNEQSLYQPDRLSEDIQNDKQRQPLEVLNFTEIKPGMKVLDLLGGGGYYTE